MKLLIKLYMVFVLTLVFSIVIHATIMKEKSIEKMTRESDLIIKGRVESIVYSWIKDGSMIHTFVTVVVEKTYKGILNQKKIVVEVPGGIIGEISVLPMGEAKFFKDEDVFLFLRKNRIIPSATYFVVGLCQGKFRINLKVTNNKNILERDLEGISLIEKKGGLIPRYLDELIDEIKKFN